MKYLQRSSPKEHVRWSLPIRGAWIEMRSWRRSTPIAPRRSPSGERGLKLRGDPRTDRLRHRRSPSGERGLKSGHHQRDQRPDRRRSPSGERGLKSCRPMRPRSGVGRSPSGERGLKSRVLYVVLQFHTSLPIRGAWIEISSNTITSPSIKSLPIRGAWIEIYLLGAFVADWGSLPIRGAWIEILCCVITVMANVSRSPSGERGLKSRPVRRARRGKLQSLPIRGAWIEIVRPDRPGWRLGRVAPHPGSVD